MIFKKLELKNFRQFKGDNEYNFSENEPITLIIASNGVGKTTFLQAFRYCFYGESPNYLKLPRSDELLNNVVKKNMKENQEIQLEVRVDFHNEGTDYIAIRNKTFIKKHNVVKEKHKEDFKVMESRPRKGYTTLDQEASSELIRKILPPGLAHVYMFDGERMEKRVETSDYKKDLKESITGMLGLKKLERALDVIGKETHTTKALGMLKSKYKSQDEETEKVLSDDKELDKNVEKLDEILLDIREKKAMKETEYEKYEKHQETINKKYEDRIQRNKLDSKLKELNYSIESESKKGVGLSLKAYKNKKLLKQYNSFQKFIDKKEEKRMFYQSLHIDTLKDIMHQEKCICGTQIKKGSDKYNKLKELENYVLPHNNAQYLKKINNEFSKAIDFEQQTEELNKIYKNLVKKKQERRQLEKEKRLLEQQIEDYELENFGESPQQTMKNLRKDLENLQGDLRKYESDKDLLEKRKKRNTKTLKRVADEGDYNKQVQYAMSTLRKIKDSIYNDFTSKQEKTRHVLEKNMNATFNDVLIGDFKVKINSDFELKIFENDFEHTEILSTGQSVMVSMSFIDALLKTFDEIRGKEKNEYQHGVLMDAALSNVDEKYITNVTNYVLNNFDQLIFLSSKRGLRHELYEGIQDGIGEAYFLEKNSDGGITTTKKSVEDLTDFIHELEIEEGDSNE